MGAVVQKKMNFTDNIVTVGFVPERYHFTVEGTGALRPTDILAFAFTALLEKIRANRDALAAAAANV